MLITAVSSYKKLQVQPLFKLWVSQMLEMFYHIWAAWFGNISVGQNPW